MHQPWATLIALGAKRIETRSWSTSYRGPIAIHAGKNRDDCADAMAGNDRLLRLLTQHGVHPSAVNDVPFGAIVATATLVACARMLRDICPGDVSYVVGGDVRFPSAQERALGWWEPGRSAWVLDDVTPLDTPIPTRGYQGLWDWDESPVVSSAALSTTADGDGTNR